MSSNMLHIVWQFVMWNRIVPMCALWLCFVIQWVLSMHKCDVESSPSILNLNFICDWLVCCRKLNQNQKWGLLIAWLCTSTPTKCPLTRWLTQCHHKETKKKQITLFVSWLRNLFSFAKPLHQCFHALCILRGHFPTQAVQTFRTTVNKVFSLFPHRRMLEVASID